MQIGVAADNIEPQQTQAISPFSTPMMVPGGTPVVQVTDWGELQTAVATAVGSVDIQVMNDITADAGAITIPAGTKVYLRSNPASSNTYSLYQDNLNERHFTVENDGELSIGNIKLTRTPNAAGASGGISNGGTLEMFTGSVISGNSSTMARAAIDNVSSSFIMWDGTISNNSAGVGGFGGGVNVAPLSSFIMKNGTISGNSSDGIAGGVGVSGGSFTMLGGTISDNSATTVGAGIIGSGGGVTINQGGTFIMEGGTIRDNTAVRGGGVAVIGTINIASNFTMKDGVISGNTATLNGGGIFTQRYDFLTISEYAIFIGNRADTAHDFYLSLQYPNVTPVQVGAAPPVFAWFGGVVPSTIQWGSTSIAGAHLLNNYDINFIGAPITYQVVTFHPNGGTFAETALSHLQADGQLQWRWISQVAVSGVTAPPPTYALAFDEDDDLRNLFLEHPTRTNYAFGGWFDSEENANGTTQEGRVLDTDDVTNASERTLWARWIRISHTVTFDLNGGNVDGNPANITHTVNQGDPVGAVRVPAPTRTNYTFVGWRYIGQVTGTPNWSHEDVADWTVTESRTFVAQWTPTTEPPPPEPPPIPPIEPPTPEPPPTEPPGNEPPPKNEPEQPPNRPDGNGPQTGDDTNLLLWNVLVLLCAVTALLSGSGLISNSTIGKKKGKRRCSSYSPLY